MWPFFKDFIYLREQAGGMAGKGRGRNREPNVGLDPKTLGS